MAERDLDELLDGSTEAFVHKGANPGGLTALCILTIVGSGLILLKDLFTYEMYTRAERLLSNTSHILDEPIKNPFVNIGYVYLIEVVSCLATVGGAIVMMMKSKVGFYVWLAGTGLYFVSTIWFYFFMLGTELDEMTMFLMFFVLGGPIAFIPLYASFRKYLH